MILVCVSVLIVIVSAKENNDHDMPGHLGHYINMYHWRLYGTSLNVIGFQRSLRHEWTPGPLDDA
ncbi:hypothetical protein HUJ04_001846 [Dendroctonus ponderosae]|nr:hypothetical protein HUJ04_001846 [Dendroctonus ponderosae]